MQKIKSIIFDMDGVISDTQKLHSKVESNILKEYRIDISPEEITNKYAGVKTSEFMEKLLRESGSDYNIEEVIHQKWSDMAKLAKEGVDEIPGSIDLIKNLNKSNYTLAVASASNFDYVTTVLKKLGVTNFFKIIISGDMVKKGKPDPESFLLASSKIASPPSQCLVIEDGKSGMEAAKRAGMKCVGLVGDIKSKYPTNNLVVSLSKITTEYIETL